jgi:putative ABC transport system permease protein
MRIVTPNYLQTYGIRLLKGREFTDSDAPQAERVVMINRAFAEKVFPGEDPVGKYLDCGGPTRVIGVAANVRNTGLTGEPRPEIYGCYQQWSFRSMFLTLRTAGNPMALAPVVTGHVRILNPAQPLNYFQTMRTLIDATTARPRFRSLVLGSFAGIALVLAAVGVYGVMAYSVAQRTHELGIRMALGARKRDVLTLILGQGLKLTLAGVLIGLAGSFALSRVLKAYLFGITTTDMPTFVSVSVILTIVALCACSIPALRAMRVNPMEALRQE